MLKKRIIVFLLLLPYHLSGTNNQQFLFDHLNTSHGLSSDNVYSIIQDAQGYIWIATSDGLNKYDGYNFKHYRHNPNNESSLINHSLTSKNSLFLDSKKRLWIITSKGISRYLPETNNFKNYIPDSSKINQPGYNYITDICEGPNGIFYFSTAWGLIFSFREETNQFNLLHQTRFGSNITDMLLYKDTLWIASGSAGLFRFDLESSKIKHFNPGMMTKTGTNLIINHLYTKDSLLYIITEQRGLLSFNLNSHQFQQEDFKSLVSPLIITEVNGDFWVGAKDGIYIRSKSNEIRWITTNSTNPYGLHSDAKAIYKDNQGNIWVGGTMGGLNILRNNYGFTRYIPNQNSNLNLSTEKVSSLFLDAANNLWVGYFSGEIDRFSIDVNTSYGPYQKEKFGDAARRGTIFEFKEDASGSLLACTFNNGLERFNPAENRFIPLNLQVSIDSTKKLVRDVRSVCQDPDGIYWIVIHGKGLCKYDMINNRQLFFFSDSGAIDKRISNVYGFDVVYDGQGYIWLSTSYGLNRIDYKSNHVTQYYFDEDNPSSIASNYTSTLFVDSQKRLWIATDNGLNLYNRFKDNFYHINENVGMNYSHIRGITEDSEGIIWVTSRMNLSQIHLPLTVRDINKSNIKVENYEVNAFSEYNEFFPGAIIYKHPGIIYNGGSKGIFTFDSHSNLYSSINIPVYITDVQVFNASIPIENTEKPGHLKEHVSLVDTIILRHNQNMLTFEFVGLHYALPGEVEYAYMLEGLENQWHHTSEKSKVTYGNLKPQQYTFKVKASVLNQKHAHNTQSLVVIIKTPFWQKAWFKGIALLFIVFVTYLFFIIRISILKKQKLKLEEKVTSRTAELRKTNELLSEKTKKIIHQKDEIERIAIELREADQIKTRFFMNISHEFKTPLTLILGPLEQLRESLNPTKNNLTLFHLIERNAKRLLRLVNQLLDLRKLETNTMKLKVSEGNMDAFLSEIYNHFGYMAKRYAVHYKFRVRPADYKCYFDKDIVEKVMYNLLSNAFKYVNDNGDINISLEKLNYEELSGVDPSIHKEEPGEYVRINIQDNGIGIEEEKLPYIFDRFYQANHATTKHQKGTGIGLSLTKELIHLHKGHILVASKKDKGTLFTILLPVSKNYFHVNEITSETGTDNTEDYPLITYELPPAAQSQKFVGQQKENTRILIVDDNYDIREYLKSCLIGKFQVIEAENGKTGFEKAQKHMPDLIIADVMMPILDGYALSQKVKNDISLNHIPFILLTAKSGKENELTGLNTGADDYITKPFYKEVLLGRINTILKNRKLTREKIKRELTDNETPILSFEEKFLQQVNSICEENMENSEFNVEQLCERLNISQPHLYRKIKNLTEHSPTEFIRILRLKKAARLIRHDSDNISQIAYDVGFTDPKYFSKCFKAFFGQSPSTYKNDL
ncbi:MAG: two-component regulator propeller domain-containing protein [Bacteroidota bacterium]